jgi:hypothetical protein
MKNEYGSLQVTDKRLVRNQPHTRGTIPKALLVVALLVISACDSRTGSTSASDGRTHQRDPEKASFSKLVDSLLLDTTEHELRASVSLVVQNPNRDDESPFSMSPVKAGAPPGPHTRDGDLYADLEVLRDLLGRELPVRLDSANHRFFVGSPEVIIYGHPHGNAWFVPVKLFSRQFGAYADIGCTLSTCANIWTRQMLEYARDRNIIGTAMLEAQAEGLINIDLRHLPTG